MCIRSFPESTGAQGGGGGGGGACGKHPGLKNSTDFLVSKCIDICPNPSPLLTERASQPTIRLGYAFQFPLLLNGNT